MTSNSENEAWKRAATAENQRSSAAKMNGGRRKAPFYKVLPGMPIAVDAFSYGKITGVTAYFLTHAHSDHYTNLSSKWENGPVYCSHTTASLIQHMLRVDRKWLHPLPMDTPTVIPDTDGVTVTLIDANHCPGSCLFYFEGRHTVDAGDTAFKSSFINSPRIFHYLHCGDFRACPRHVRHPAILGKRMDQVYLDTTYLDPKYTFPPQPLVISACAELATRLVRGEHSNSGLAGWLSKSVPTSLGLTSTPKKEKKILFIVGTYSIGKERIVKAIAHALGSKVYCDARKMSYLQRQPDPELHAMLTANAQEADVHVIPLGLISAENIKPYLNRHQGPWTHVVALRPTGWSFSPTAGADPSPSISTIISRAQSRTFTYEDLKPSRNSTAAIQLFPVPYSEHSSFSELTCFAMSMDWRKIIATVNVGSERSRAKMAKWFGRWEADRRKSPVGYVVESRSPDYW
ncbi:DRMBL-domain-containing protein [Fistulina hepatica ATCC 64428]|uniref:DRMBL-domain-containing protein n=1 Tax=Fistulina hepatica ATCC 64428 TaxID=1128425 RepID=A0A0D7A3N1_9AGAR|nr:DRMBL-domain-containing protein [Fistulina hepatica ATCC 64428]